MGSVCGAGLQDVSREIERANSNCYSDMFKDQICWALNMNF